MQHIALEQCLSYSKEQLFELVADIAAYPEFIPWCEKATIVKQEGNTLWVDLTIGYKGLNKSYRSQVELDRIEGVITSKLVSGPLSHLDQTWQFVIQSSGKTNVLFTLEYEFKSLLLSTIMTGFSHYFADQFMNAFVRRAEEMYGKEGS